MRVAAADDRRACAAAQAASEKYRSSVGDEVLFTERIFDHKGGTRLGTLYGEGKVVKGAYQGARGSVISVISTTDDSSQDTITLLP